MTGSRQRVPEHARPSEQWQRREVMGGRSATKERARVGVGEHRYALPPERKTVD